MRRLQAEGCLISCFKRPLEWLVKLQCEALDGPMRHWICGPRLVEMRVEMRIAWDDCLQAATLHKQAAWR